MFNGKPETTERRPLALMDHETRLRCSSLLSVSAASKAFLLGVVFAVLMLAGCAAQPQGQEEGNPTTEAPQAPTTQAPEPLTFHGYVCTVDCSGHEAGYEWAEEHDITDPDDCGGNSESFIEGC